jgi:2-octaprenyl-6-methoxyphenol hydroxylase
MDVAIIGAGPVGAMLALLLARAGREARVFEARPSPSGDRRTLALSHASRERIEDAGGWPPDGSTPITSIHISQEGGPGRTLIESRDQGLAALGHTLAYADLEAAQHAALRAAGVVPVFSEPCERIDLEHDRVRIGFASGREEEARLLVLADGGANASRIPGLAFDEKDYGQVAVVGSIGADRHHGGRAWERFTPRGPMALLPVRDRYALVWTATTRESERLLALEDAAFVSELQARFGDRAGRFGAPGPRATFPLRLRVVNTPIARRVAIIGNAAQALHPVAGQGLNLGLRDAAHLADTLRGPSDPGDAEVLRDYRESRRRDATRGAVFTDLLVSAFADGRRLPTWGRGVALAALDLFGPARRLLADRMIHGAPAP